ncbi:MAG: Glycosyl transferase [Candidatus Collierbacteria bacterium GW2011_GWC2_44_18]|uniref:Glycosyl transferase n=2 Tax=Microgenomates group TaxID=1794810 RepID=A0A0G1J6J2_9BACT|nr:MAG: Glycosyl transferase [Microgenomates group bacterium GW2011_GWC1_44_10]KKT49639.1 MAG: Glycosyl transferase [Candidatus Collierbacteria bacterium GW2011_GWC2_44_18]KKT67246.1 MAG: Glycosyl transferase [Candidatus Woesebacteria bacterium GW2011_GWA2_44_33]
MKLSVIILTRNVEDEIIPAIKSSQFADEIIAVDTGSTDATLDICRKNGVKIVYTTTNSFSKWRNDGAKAAKGDWLLYLDSDERIPVKLAQEILATIDHPKHSGYTISRYEVFLGKHLNHWGDSRVLRFMKRSSLKCWEGKLHEQPKIDGTVGDLRQQMVHLSHKNIDEKLPNTLLWSKTEAIMLLNAGHPPMVGWRFVRIMFTEFWNRCLKQGLWKDGTEGWIEIIYQMFSKFVTYERLWEMQRQPSLKETYKDIDKQILSEWEKQAK